MRLFVTDLSVIAIRFSVIVPTTGVKMALCNRGINDGGGSATMRERSEGVGSHGTFVTEFVSLGHFCLALYSFEPPSRTLVVITWRGEGCRYMMWLG